MSLKIGGGGGERQKSTERVKGKKRQLVRRGGRTARRKKVCREPAAVISNTHERLRGTLLRFSPGPGRAPLSSASPVAGHHGLMGSAAPGIRKIPQL